MKLNSQEIIDDFLKVVKLAGVDQNEIEATVEVLPAPHVPPSNLPKGKMAVYAFVFQEYVLKVGKVGPNSQARYTSQHYNPGSAPSTLAATIIKRGSTVGINDLSEENVSEWIKKNTDRFNFLINASSGKHVLSLLESYLQCRLRPVFEGFASQK